MLRIDDEKLREIFETRFTIGVPKHVAAMAHKIAHLLVAARDLQDVGVLGTILRWRKGSNRYGLHIHGKWHVTFAWNNAFGAYKIRLERG